MKSWGKTIWLGLLMGMACHPKAQLRPAPLPDVSSADTTVPTALLAQPDQAFIPQAAPGKQDKNLQMVIHMKVIR